MAGVSKEEHLVTPIHFRAYYDPILLRGNPKTNDEPHGIVKIMSRCECWFRSPNSSEFYSLNIQKRSLLERLDEITIHPNDYVRFVKVSKAEYDTYNAFELFPEYEVTYRPLRSTFEKHWLNILLGIFYVHLAIILFLIPISFTPVGTEEINRQVLIAIGSWITFSASSLCCWLVASFVYWRKIRRGLATPSGRASPHVV